MYIHFKYRNGSNPYITTTNENLFKMICKYYLYQTGEKAFEVGDKINAEFKQNKSPYQFKQYVLRMFAIEWQYDFADMRYSWGDLSEWGAFFEEYGKKYGLLREFRENGIC